MIEHVVLFKWKPDASRLAIDAAAAALKGLADRIPGIVDLSCGPPITDQPQQYSFGLVVRFKDRPSFEAYGPHPAHVEVVQTYLLPIMAEALNFDFEKAI
ncbi:MAG: Stress responsive Barrel Domain [Chloroflexi bacterium]|jgi:hypothetical protein|nr:Stress responsive Barrel Domain [Chloroflexota bacterium]